MNEGGVIQEHQGRVPHKIQEKETMIATDAALAAALEKGLENRTNMGGEKEPAATKAIPPRSLEEIVEEDVEAMDIPEENLDENIAGNNEEEDVFTKDSTSNAPSEKEMSEMKEQDPASAFKLLVKLSSSSTNLTTSSSTTSLASVDQESIKGLLQQLKAKILEDDILARIGTNPQEYFKVKELLQKLRKLKPSEELLIFLLEFDSLFETLSNGVKKRLGVLKRKEQADQLHQEQLSSLKTLQTEFCNLEAQKQQNEKAFAKHEIAIQHYKDKIEDLQSKLRNAELQRDLLRERMAGPESKLNAAALKGIDQLGKVNQQKATIAQLDEELEELEASISASSKILDRLKDTLRNIQ